MRPLFRASDRGDLIPFSLLTVAGVRAHLTAEGKLEDQILVPYDKLLTKSDELIIASVTSITRPLGTTTGGTLTLSTGAAVPFAFLVLASGSTWPSSIDWPLTKEEIAPWLAEHRAKVAAAKSIVVVGGGAVGIEFAGELTHWNPVRPRILLDRM